MLRITIIVNTFILFGFWGVSAIAIAPAFNQFVLYAEGDPVYSLPMLTAAICKIRFSSISIPFVWLFFSLIFIKWLGKKQTVDQAQWIQLHTSISILCGVIILIVFALAGILPFLKIGGVI